MIINEIGTAAVLEQLAEEATELAQAALKYARKLRGENPTPLTIDQITKNLIEEYTDVQVCASILQLQSDFMLGIYKMGRWEERLKENDKA